MNTRECFESEEELAQALCKPRSNLEKIEPGLEPLIREFPAWHGERIDLLCRSAHGDLVAVELKANKADYKAFGQMLIYLLYLSNPKARPFFGKKHRENQVRGVILAHEIGKDLKWLVAEYGENLPRIDLKEYRRTTDGVGIENVLPQVPERISSRFKGPLRFV